MRLRLVGVDAERGPIKVDLPNLDPVTILVGQNESGKTTTLELIQQAVAGPSRSSRPAPWRASLWFTGGQVHRRVDVDAETDMSSQVVDVSFDGHGRSTKVREADSIVAAALGRAWAWDARALFGASAPERRKVIGALVGAAVSTQAMTDALHRHEAGFRALSEAAKAIPEIRAAAEDCKRIPAENGPEFGARWLDGLRRAKTATQNRAEELRGNLDSMAARVADARDVFDETRQITPGSLGFWTQRVAAAEQADQAARAAVAEHAARREGVAAAERARDAAAKRVEDLDRARDRATARPSVDLDALVSEVQAAAAAVQAANDTHTAALRDMDEALDALRNVRARIGLAAAAHALAHLLHPVLISAVEGPEVNELRALLETPAEATDANEEAVAQAASARQRAAHGRCLTTQQKYAQAARQAETARAAIQQEAEAETKRVADLAAAEQELAARRADLEAVTANARAEAEAKRAADLAAAEQELAARRADLEGLGEASGVALLEQDAAVTARELDEARSIRDRILQYETIVADHDRSSARVVELTELRSYLHQREKAAELALAELYTAAVAKLAGPASEITRAVLGRDVLINPADGWLVGLDRPIEHLSESTVAVVGIALHVAVVLLSDAPWRAVLLDGLEVVEDRRREALVSVLRDLCDRGDLSNVILACVDDGYYPRRGTVVRLRRGSHTTTSETTP